LSSLVDVDGGRVDVAEMVLLKPLRDTSKVSRVKLSSMSKIFYESQWVLRSQSRS
jgi:hypothetical protein